MSANMDSPSNTMDTRSIHEQLIDFLHSGKYKNADVFVKSLEKAQSTQALTAILIAHIWWQQGDFIRARKAIQAVDLESALDDAKTALTLLDASFGQIIDLKIKSSLAIANILRERGNVVTDCSSAQDITRCEALSLIYYFRIRLTAAISGFDRHMDTLEEAWEELYPLLLRFKHEGRFDEELFLLKWTTARMINLPVQTKMEMLEDFIARVVGSYPEPTASYLVGHAFFAAGSMLLKTRKMESFSQSPLERAVMRYKASKHAHGVNEVAMLLATDASTLLSIADGFSKTPFYSGEVDAVERAANFINAGGTVPSSSPDFLARVTRRCEDYGMKLTLFLTYSSHVRRANLKEASGIGATMSFWERFIAGVDLEEIGPVMGYNISHSMMTAYREVNEVKKGLKWAEIAYKISSKGMFYEDRTKAVVDYALALKGYSSIIRPRNVLSDYMGEQDPEKRPGPTEQPVVEEGREKPDTRSKITQAIELLESWIMMDYMVGFKNGVGAQEKTVALISCYLSRWRVEGRQKSNGDLLAVEGLIDTYNNTWSPERHGDDVKVKDCKIDLLRMSGDSATAIQLARLKVSQIGDVERITDEKECNIALYDFELLATCLQERVLYELLPEGGKEELEEIISATKKALPLLQRADAGVEICFGILSLRVWALELLTNLYNEEARILYDDDTKETRLLEQLVATVDSEIQRTATLRNNLDVAVQGSPAVFGKAVQARAYTDDYLLDVGIRVLLELGREEEAWRWMQTSKTRSLAGQMGAGMMGLLEEFEKAVIENGDSHKELQALLFEESRLKTIVEQANSGDQVPAMAQLRDIRSKLHKNPSMSKLIALCSCDFQSNALEPAKGEENIVYADWYLLKKGPKSERLTRGENWSYGNEESPVVLFLRKGSNLSVRHLNIPKGRVDAWAKENLRDSPDGVSKLVGENGDEMLSQLSALLDGITEVAQPNDLIVLCPTTSLHGVPLHAIHVEPNRPLIDRNPVVYATSIANFKQCCLRADFTSKLQCDSPPQFLGVCEEPDLLREHEAIYESLTTCATQVNGTATTGTKATTDKFREVAEAARWVHFHGSTHFDSASPFQASLVLSDGLEPPALPDDTEDVEPARFQVLNMLSLSLKYSPTFVIVPRESDNWKVGYGGEPIGMLTSLLYGGAASVLGLMWPVHNHTGLAFSTALYENITAQLNDAELTKTAINLSLADEDKPSNDGEERDIGRDVGNMVDLANAYRAAVKAMRAKQEMSAPYHWAAFVLCGSPNACL